MVAIAPRLAGVDDPREHPVGIDIGPRMAGEGELEAGDDGPRVAVAEEELRRQLLPFDAELAPRVPLVLL